MAKLIRDVTLAAKLRIATADGEAVVEADGDGDRFLVVRVPHAIELTDNEDIDLALDAAAEYVGPRYSADEVLDLFRHEVAEERRPG